MSPPALRKNGTEALRARLPYLVALIAGGIAAVVTWSLVRDDVVYWGGFNRATHAEYRFVLFFSAIAAGVGWFAGRRLFHGPLVSRVEWTLLVPRVTARAEDYRTMSTPTVRNLVERLAHVGYEPRVASANDLGHAVHPCKESTLLVGARVRLTDPRLGARGGVVVRVSENTDRMAGVGFVEATNVSSDAYEEMALFIIAALAELFPGLSYKPIDSTLSSDDADLLAATLPERPKALPPARHDSRGAR